MATGTTREVARIRPSCHLDGWLARELGERRLVEAVRSERGRRYVRLRPAGRRLLRTAMRC
jgi:hypothetical protein